MKTGLAMLVALTFLGAVAGGWFGKWLAYENSRDPSLGEPIFIGIGGIVGAIAGLALGLGIAYAIGRNNRPPSA